MLEKLSRLIIVLSLLLGYCLSSFGQNSPLKYNEECFTSTNQTGKCVSINSCPRAFNILLNIQENAGESNSGQVQQLRQMQCGSNGNIPYVCCPTNEIQLSAKVREFFNGLQCGMSSQNKIANGAKAHILAYRWMALLKYENAPIFKCGGSLISSRYVLTAAHCFNDGKILPNAVRLGEYDLETETDCTGIRKSRICLPPYEDIGIQHIFVPHEYVFAGIYHDIGLIRLEREVHFGRGIRPICLPVSEELKQIQPDWYTVAGWGRNENETTTTVLFEATIPSQSIEFCHHKLPVLRGKLNNGHICAGGELLRDSCKGDSGGPLFSTSQYTDGVSRSIQFGIVSFGVKYCGRYDMPAIYTNVSHYINWIMDHIVI